MLTVIYNYPLLTDYKATGQKGIYFRVEVQHTPSCKSTCDDAFVGLYKKQWMQVF